MTKNDNINKLLINVKKEPAEFRADELIILGEEILNNVAALGVAIYIEKAEEKQLDQFNDYVLNNLFLNKAHQNAGNILKNVCLMLKSFQLEKYPELIPLLDIFQTGNKWNTALNDLSKFRNSLMHGFFVLPASTNEEQTKKIEELLVHLSEIGVFNFPTNYHFRDKNGFKGSWHINEGDKQAWDKLKNTSLFGQLIQQVEYELFDPLFWEKASFEMKQTIPDKISEAISNNTFGSIACWFHPEDNERQNDLFQSLVFQLNQSIQTDVIAYSIHENGIAYTEDFLFNNKIIKDRIELIKKNRASNSNNEIGLLENKIIIIVNDFHLGLFSSNHLVNAFQKLKEFQINVIALGYEYEYLNSFFDLKISFNDSISLSSEEVRKKLIINYLRFRGPFNGEKEFDLIVDSMNEICNNLKNKEEIYARKFAEEKNIDSILVEEVFSMLYPMLKYNDKKLVNSFDINYEEDEVHELFGFPIEIKETSSIYLALRRRDVKLELKHKLLTL